MQKPEEQNLKEVLPQHLEIPKSYHRYLTYPVIEKDGSRIAVQTPRGAVVYFEIYSNSLKKLKLETGAFPSERDEERTVTMKPEELLSLRDDTMVPEDVDDDLVIEPVVENSSSYEEFTDTQIFEESSVDAVRVSTEERPVAPILPSTPKERLLPTERIATAQDTVSEQELAVRVNNLERVNWEERLNKLETQDEKYRKQELLTNVNVHKKMEFLEERLIKLENLRLWQELSQRVALIEQQPKPSLSRDEQETIQNIRQNIQEWDKFGQLINKSAERISTLETWKQQVIQDWDNLNKQVNKQDYEILTKNNQGLQQTLQTLRQNHEQLNKDYLNLKQLVEQQQKQQEQLATIGQRLDRFESTERATLIEKNRELAEKVKNLEDRLAKFEAQPRPRTESFAQQNRESVRPVLAKPVIEAKKTQRLRPWQEKMKGHIDAIQKNPTAENLPGVLRTARNFTLGLFWNICKNPLVSLYAALVLLVVIWQPWFVENSANMTTDNESAQTNSSSSNNSPEQPYEEPKNWNIRREERIRPVEPEVSTAESRAVIAKFVEMSESLSENERLEAALKLGDYQDISAGRALIKLLDDESIAVRSRALRSLTQNRYRGAIEKVLIILKDRSLPYAIRCEALDALGSIGHSDSGRVTDSMKQVMDDPSEDIYVRASAAHAMGILGDASASSALVKALDYPEPEIQTAAIKALGEFGYPPAASKIINLLESDSVHDVRLAAATALGNMRDKASLCAEALLRVLPKVNNQELRDAIKVSLQQLYSGLSGELKGQVSAALSD